MIDYIYGMCLFDDDLMARVFDGNIPAVELLLETVLGERVRVTEAKGQVELKNPEARGSQIPLAPVFWAVTGSGPNGRSQIINWCY